MEEIGRQRLDSYFRERDRELIEKLRRDARRRAEKERLAEATGLDADHELLEHLAGLGFDADTVTLLHLIPLLEVAWADGSVSPHERELVVEAARAHGVEPGSKADGLLQGWLDTKPSEELFGKALGVVKVLIGVRPEEEQRSSHESLLALCSEIAAVSGGILGFGRVSAAEQKVLARVASEMERTHEASAKRVVDAL